MRRRSFILGSMAAAWPVVVRAQQPAVPAIGFMNSGASEANADLRTAFRRGVGEAGYTEGQNVTIEYRWAEGSFDRLPALATELVARKVDVIVAAAGDQSALAAKQATSTIPIVFTSANDPVAAGLVASLARPGGNLSWFAVLGTDLNPKRLELLSELVLQAKVIALLVK
jgi:putative tryptophan/tyrosine transport system substrate-binding protein